MGEPTAASENMAHLRNGIERRYCAVCGYTTWHDDEVCSICGAEPR